MGSSQEIANNHIAYRFLRNPAETLCLSVYPTCLLGYLRAEVAHLSVDIDIMTTMCFYSRMLALVHNFKCFTSLQLCRDLPDPILISIINFQYCSSSMLDYFFQNSSDTQKEKSLKFFIKRNNLASLMHPRRASRHS